MGKAIQNTFQKGVITDCSVHNQPNNSLRDSMNGTVMNPEVGVYQWAPIKGTKKLLPFPEGFVPIQYYSFPDEIIFWLASETLPGIIVSITFDDEWVATMEYVYTHEDLQFSINRPLRVFGYEENENLKRIYWSDRVDEPYVLNLKQNRGLITLSSDASNLTDHTYYLLATGTVAMYNSHDVLIHTFYPGEVFLYLSTGYTFVASGTVRLILHLEQLKWQPNATPLIVKYKEEIAGNLFYGNYKMAYRYGCYSGFISPNIFIEDFAVTKTGLASDAFDKYQATEGDSHLNNSSKGIHFELSQYDPTYDYLELIAIHAISEKEYENGLVVSTVSLPKIPALLSVDFTSLSGTGNVTVNELLLNPVPVRSIGDMTVIKKQAVITNFKERKELPIGQQIPCTIQESVYKILADVTGTPGYDTAYKALVSSIRGGLTYVVYPGQWYKVVGGTINYESVLYTVGKLFCATTIDTVSEQVMPVFVRQTHINNGTGLPVIEVSELHDWLDYKDPVLATQASAFWGDSDIHLGIMFFDKKMIPYFGRYLGKHRTSARNVSQTDKDGIPLSLLSEYINFPDKVYSINALSLIINDLDLSSVINDIGAFCICKVPSKNPIVSEGWLEPIKYTDDTQKDYHERAPFLSMPESVTDSNFKRRSNWYFYVSPEFLFNNGVKAEILEADKLRIERYHTGARVGNWTTHTVNPYAGIHTHTMAIVGTTYYNYQHLYQKSYVEGTPTNAEAIGESNNILKAITVEVDIETQIKFDENQPGYFFKNLARRKEMDAYPVGGKGILLKTERKEDGTDLQASIGFGSYDNPSNFGITIVQQRRNEVAIGASVFDIEKLELVQISPLQIVNETFISQIYDTDAEAYIVNGLQVFGGGCFVNIFDHVRVMQNIYERESSSSAERLIMHSDAVIIPLQSNFNIALRKGKHIASVRSFDDHTLFLGDYTVVNPAGISYNSILTGVTGMPAMWESFLYDDSYHNLGNAFRYPVLPANYIDQERFFARCRYSTTKIAGETIDSFRKYLVNNYIDLDAQNGPITNIDGTYDKLFYWQYHAVGYIPVGERELVPSSIGAPIQLGVGGAMERSDKLDSYYGNQHTFGLLKCPNGFIWTDYLRSELLFLSQGGSLKKVATDNLFRSSIKQYQSGLQIYDNPFINTGGISCGYDPELKLAYFTYLSGLLDIAVTIGVHTETLDFMGRFSFTPAMYCNFNNSRLFSVSLTLDETLTQEESVRFKFLYLHNAGKLGFIYDWYARSWADVIVSSKGEHVKFDVLQFLCGDYFFDRIQYLYHYTSNKFQYDVEEVSTDTRYYKQYGDIWKASVPIVSTGRISGTVILVRCILIPSDTNQKDLALSDLKTLVREYKL